MTFESKNEDFLTKVVAYLLASLDFLFFSFVTAKLYRSFSGLNVESTRATAGHRIRRSKARMKIFVKKGVVTYLLASLNRRFFSSFVTANRCRFTSGLNAKSTRATAGHGIRRSKAGMKI